MWHLVVLSALCGFVATSQFTGDGLPACTDFVCSDPDTVCEIGADGQPTCVRKCQTCPADEYEPVCGADKRTYRSFCVLEEVRCMTGIDVKFACKGECPCDPPEVEKMDPETVHTLQGMRTVVQLEDEVRNAKKVPSDELVTLEVLGDDNIQDDAEEKKYAGIAEKIEKAAETIKDTAVRSKLKGAERCPAEEMNELPGRLVDWFHVLKANEKKRLLEKEGLSKKSVLREMKFYEAKLKSMYAKYACTSDESEELCSESVKWMFRYLDSDNDGRLSSGELYEIEDIRNEHCIKPFLTNCDYDGNGKVLLKEFCQCLCVEPPCTKIMEKIPTILLRGVPKPVGDFFTPKCDEDGFFMPTQCHRGECWCVDRNGAEYDGTRLSNGTPDCGV